ncbi:hypothetical protein [Methanosarcina sp. WWM596]|uniref:hypothetical protein n=1 Tax=Methanosarcina sp. WWM596 TaxID=1434103 RepID=UPI0009E208DA
MTTNTVTATVPVGLAHLGTTFGKVKKLVGKNRNKKSDRFNFKSGFDYTGLFKKTFQRHGVSLETAYFVGVCSH